MSPVAKIVFVFVVGFISGCGSGDNGPSATSSSEDKYRITKEYLTSSLWTEKEAYDATHALMVPMHAAFTSVKYRGLQSEFDLFFERVFENKSAIVSRRQTRLQFFYLISQYLKLKRGSAGCAGVSVEKVTWLAAELTAIAEAPAWQWAASDFPNMIARLDWKLANHVVDKQYWRAIVDEELFAMAVAADLTSVSASCNVEVPSLVNELSSKAFYVFASESKFTDAGGWLFQPGVWYDHPDYIYAGNTVISDSVSPSLVPGIATDSSHSFRIPLMLTSFICATQSDPQKLFFERIRAKLAHQFSNAVAILPTTEFPSIRLTNFMDGQNGLYRWQYVTAGQNNGYGPFELSGSFLLGWWAFLGPETGAYYQLQEGLFPLTSGVIETYVGPNTTRERNQLVTLPAFYTNGFSLEIVRAAKEIHDDSCR